MNKHSVKEKENTVELDVDTNIYDLDVVYSASYNFLDRAYIVLDGDPKKTVKVSLRGKDKMSKEDLESLAGNFFNELISCDIRLKVSKKNKAIREYIVGTALMGSSPVLQKKVEEECVGITGTSSDAQEEDPLGITMTWEEKNDKEKGKEK